MAENSAISWTDHTFNPWWGCTKVGPGCDHCYAESFDKRVGGSHWGAGAPRRLVKDWTGPRKWNREAVRTGVSPWVFCASMADVFDNEVPPEWRVRLWDLVRETPSLLWIFVTKRIGNAAKMLPEDWTSGAFAHCGLVSTIVNQAEADRDIPKLLDTPAAWRGLSMEPLLGPVKLDPWLAPDKFCEQCDDGEGYGSACSSARTPREAECPWRRAVQIETRHPPFSDDGMPASITYDVRTLDWIIVGGESGPGARPMHPDWARSLRDQCAFAGVPFHFKQWGAYRIGELEDDVSSCIRWQDGSEEYYGEHQDIKYADYWLEHSPAGKLTIAYPASKKLTGRSLDGREHNGMPPHLPDLLSKSYPPAA